MTPEEEQRLAELEELDRLRSEVGVSEPVSEPDPVTPTPERSWLESGYDAVKDWGVPATQLGIDVGTSLLKVGGPAGWAAQPVVSSALGWYPETALRFAGETVDNLFGTNLEPNGGYREIANETSNNAIKNAAIGMALGGGLEAAGWGIRGLGKVSRSLFDMMPYKRKAVLPPSVFSTTAGQEAGDATIAALEKEGVFPPSLDRNPFLASQDALEAIKNREGATLSSLRNEVDAQMTTPFSQKEILQSPSAYERYGKYNNLGEQVPDEMVTFENLLERNSTPELLNMSGIAGRKEGYRRTADSMPLPKTFEGQIYRTFSEAMKDKELELISKLEPEKRAQYLASLELYGRAASSTDVGANWAGSLATATKDGKGIGASFGDQSGLRFFTSLGGLTSEPQARTLYNKAFSPQTPVGKWLGGSGGQAIIKGGQALMNKSGFIGSIEPEVSGMFSSDAKAIDSGPLLSNLTEPKAIAISRNLNQVDAAAIDALIPSYVEDYNAQPLQFQFKRLVAEGDKSKIADFLGQLTSKYPDFPMQRGAVTGLPSEFDLGDGVARLISPIDKSEYERRVNVSELNVMEKAMRIKAIREQGIAHRFDIPLLNDPGPMTSKQPSSGGYQFAPRQQTASGSRKVE